MAHVREFSATAVTGKKITLTAPAAIPAGHALLVGVECNPTSGVALDFVGSDARGNTGWSNQLSKQVTGQTMCLNLLKCVVTRPISSGDTIVMTTAATILRGIAICNEFDDSAVYTTTDTKLDAAAGASSASPTTGAFTPTPANSLLVGFFGLVSPTRTPSAGSGWTQGAKVVTAVGSADRAAFMQWRYLTPASSVSCNASLDSGSIYGAEVIAMDLTAPPASPFTMKDSFGVVKHLGVSFL